MKIFCYEYVTVLNHGIKAFLHYFILVDLISPDIMNKKLKIHAFH